MIKESPGFYYTIATLNGATGVGMLFAAYWSYEAGQAIHVIFSLTMVLAGGWFARIFILRAGRLKRGRTKRQC